MPPRTEVVTKVYDGVEFEIIPLSHFTSSDRVGTASAVLENSVTPYDEEHDERVQQAKKARSCVKRLGRRKST